MKSVLLFSMLLFSGIFSNQLLAQGQGNGNGNSGPTSACGIYDILIQNIRLSSEQTAGNCTVEFDVAFSMNLNNGNKNIFLQSYIASVTGASQNNPHPYPNHFECENGTTRVKKAPTAEEAGNPLLNVYINNNGDQPVFGDEYLPDPALELVGVTDNTAISSVELANGDTRFIITGLQVVLPNPCGTAQYEFVTDVFSSQTPNAQTLHCVSCGIMATGGAVNFTGIVACDLVTGTLTNTSMTEQTVTYQLYADNGDGVLATENTNDVLLTEETVVLAPGESMPIVYNMDDEYVGRDIFMVFEIGGARRAQILPLQECIPLPVNFGNFTASRNRSNVQLVWVTETEQNSRGFELQRELGDNRWQTVAFIPSRAEGGNSTSTLRYEYTDMNTHRGISNYRIRQVDYDGQMMISPVRSVRGEGQPNGTIIFPNPSSNGQVSVMFESVNTSYDINLLDMSGRILRNWANYNDNRLQITNLQPGMYMLRIINRETGVVSNEKIVVSRN